jgi:regulator of RNase E activity RraA
MDNKEINTIFNELSTPLIADACLSLGITIHVARIGIHPLVKGWKITGRVLPARHYGSVDIFLEAMQNAEPGDILTVDNDGRGHEGCIGDLTPELTDIGFPVFSYGSCPKGPRRAYPRASKALTMAKFGDFRVGRDDIVFADDDGVVFVPLPHVEDVMACARDIWQTERRQADKIKAGQTLSQQLLFEEYLKKRTADPTYTFRKHLQKVGGAIEV